MQHHLGHLEKPFRLDDEIRVIPNRALEGHRLDPVGHQPHVLAPREVVLVEQVVVDGQLLAQIATLLEAGKRNEIRYSK